MILLELSMYSWRKKKVLGHLASPRMDLGGFAPELEAEVSFPIAVARANGRDESFT